MRYFIARGEDRRLDAGSRQHLRGSFVELSDGITHYELTGPEDGDVAVLVGGLTIPLFYLDDLVPRLHQCGFRTLAYSTYGRGYSDRVRATYDEALFVRQLADLTAGLGVRAGLHVVGSSMGALIAMAYANGHAESVSTLTVIGPAGLRRQVLSPDRMLRNDRVAGLVARRFGRRLLENHLRHNVRDPDRAADLAKMIRDAYRYEGSIHALFDTLQHVRLSGRAELYHRTHQRGLPTLLLWGSDDQVTPVDDLPQAQALLKPLQCHVVDACGHMVPFERPGDVADLVSTFATPHLERRDS